jgi:hypothetical protein
MLGVERSPALWGRAGFRVQLAFLALVALKAASNAAWIFGASSASEISGSTCLRAWMADLRSSHGFRVSGEGSDGVRFVWFNIKDGCQFG